jgi:stage II sporulation protein AA (anti-sigma F factor antagonist)
MPVQLHYEKCRLTAALSGEIDHHNAAGLRGEIDQALAKLRPPALTLDFDGVTFMDSSAVGLVMGRYKSICAFGGEMEVINLSPVAYRMMQLSGLQSLAKLKPKEEKERAHT